AHNIGAAEAQLGAETLRRIAQETGVQLVSANVRDEQNSFVGASLCTVERGGRRVAIVGVLSPSFAVRGLKIDSPREAVLEALSRNQRKYDLAIVLAYLPQAELEALAAQLPE